MILLRLILLFFVGLFVRRLFKRSTQSGANTAGPTSSFGSGASNPSGTRKSETLGDITEQEIDDADFEEIP